MTCRCKKGAEIDSPQKTRPEEPCIFCAEKHFSTAWALARENGYEDVNRERIIGEIVLAQWHVYQDNHALAEDLRELRHLVQQKKEKEIGAKWDQLAGQFARKTEQNTGEATSTLEQPNNTTNEQGEEKKRVIIFSNVQYPEERKLETRETDILVFLNKAFSAPYYEHAPAERKLLFRRDHKEDNFGPEIPWCENFVVGGPGDSIPASVKREIRGAYSFDYECVNNGNRGSTTGYIVTKYMEKLFPDREIVLVNFGYEVKNSTFRCEYHNWEFEAEDLAKFKHIYTADTVGKDPVKTVFYELAPWMGDALYATAVLECLAATGKYRINVSDAHAPLWKNCPFLDRTITRENADYHLREHNRYPWRSGCPHIIEGTVHALEQDLGCKIPIITKTPKIYNDIPEGRLIERPYILINTGWQNSCETKRWSREYWKKLIELMPDFTFVQMGQRRNHAERIDGIVNMIDKTDELQLCQLVRDAACVVSPPSGCIHIAGALHVPFVSIAGGREPDTLLTYPEGKVLCECGNMNCCRSGGCRNSFFGGGTRECQAPAVSGGQIVAQCMLNITPERVRDAIREVLK